MTDTVQQLRDIEMDSHNLPYWHVIDNAANELFLANRTIEVLREALRDVLVYCPEYMHGMPIKHYAKIAARK